MQSIPIMAFPHHSKRVRNSTSSKIKNTDDICPYTKKNSNVIAYVHWNFDWFSCRPVWQTIPFIYYFFKDYWKLKLCLSVRLTVLWLSLEKHFVGHTTTGILSDILTDSTSTGMKHVDVLQTQYFNSADLRSFLDTGSTQTHVYPCLHWIRVSVRSDPNALDSTNINFDTKTAIWTIHVRLTPQRGYSHW